MSDGPSDARREMEEDGGWSIGGARSRSLDQPAGSLPKFYILEYGDGANTLHAFDTREARDDKTIELIFGEPLLTQNDAEAWDHYREELNDTGQVRFEGDPGLDWFTAHPAREANTTCSQPGEKPTKSQ